MKLLLLVPPLNGAQRGVVAKAMPLWGGIKKVFFTFVRKVVKKRGRRKTVLKPKRQGRAGRKILKKRKKRSTEKKVKVKILNWS